MYEQIFSAAPEPAASPARIPGIPASETIIQQFRRLAKDGLPYKLPQRSTMSDWEYAGHLNEGLRARGLLSAARAEVTNTLAIAIEQATERDRQLTEAEAERIRTMQAEGASHHSVKGQKEKNYNLQIARRASIEQLEKAQQVASVVDAHFRPTYRDGDATATARPRLMASPFLKTQPLPAWVTQNQIRPLLPEAVFNSITFLSRWSKDNAPGDEVRLAPGFVSQYEVVDKVLKYG